MSNPLLKCVGCGKAYTIESNKVVFSCENREEGKVHILEKILPNEFTFDIRTILDLSQNSYNPYLLFKRFFYSYYIAKKLNVDFKSLILKINDKLTDIGEPGLEITPLIIKDNMVDIPGRIFIKNETYNVAGSHKVRHMMGNIIYLEILRESGIISPRPRLAMYSCGNAALGASAVAKATGYELDVFIPESVNPVILKKLNDYGARLIECERIPGESRDPCYNRFQEALALGSVPFSCAGPDNWANIEGGQTLCLELIAQTSLINQKIDAVFIQVGGGALASSTIKTLEELYLASSINTMPTIYTVQTEGAYPLARAYLTIIVEIALKNNLECSLSLKDITERNSRNREFLKYLNNGQNELLEIAEFCKSNYTTNKVQDILSNCTQNMSKYMWAWEETPYSVAHGILDDVTYDWFKIVQGMLFTGGIPVTVTEDELIGANNLAKKYTNINVDHTGSSGFAGYIKLKKLGLIQQTANTAVFFTGIER